MSLLKEFQEAVVRLNDLSPATNYYVQITKRTTYLIESGVYVYKDNMLSGMLLRIKELIRAKEDVC